MAVKDNLNVWKERLSKDFADMKKAGLKKTARDFWYGKPHTAEEGGRRLGELHKDKTNLYYHREWRGVKDTLYYFYMIWLYNYIFMVKDVMVMGGLVTSPRASGVTAGSARPICRFCTGSTAASRVCAARP